MNSKARIERNPNGVSKETTDARISLSDGNRDKGQVVGEVSINVMSSHLGDTSPRFKSAINCRYFCATIPRISCIVCHQINSEKVVNYRLMNENSLYFVVKNFKRFLVDLFGGRRRRAFTLDLLMVVMSEWSAYRSAIADRWAITWVAWVRAGVALVECPGQSPVASHQCDMVRCGAISRSAWHCETVIPSYFDIW